MSTPSKAQDPAAAALSAIEDALRLHVEPEADSVEGQAAGTEASPKLEFHLPTSKAEAQESNAPAPRLPDAAADEFGKRPRETDSPRPVVAPGALPANDDRPSVGQILQSLQTRPDSTGMTVAIIGSAAWTGLWIGYVMFTHAAAFTGSLFSPAAAISAFALIGPVIFFLSMGAVLRRSQEMRHTARSMAEVAIRLAEPETIATEQVVSLSQAIRREVASMGDGIERALARASEMETMVRAEVSSLERTYGENERRIRLLLNELASEREAIIVNADRVTTALSHAQNSVASELEAATEKLTGLLDQTGGRIVRALEDKGGDLESTFAKSGDAMMQQLETRAASLLERFERSGEEASGALQSRSVRIDGDLQAFANAFLEKVNARSESLSQNLEDVCGRLNEFIGRRADDLSGRLEGQADRLHEIVAVQGPALQDSLAALGDGLSQRLRDELTHTQNLFSASGDTFAQTLNAHRARVTDEFAAAAGAAMEQMTERADALRAHVGETTHRVVEDFSQNVEAIGRTYANVSLQTVESVAGHAESLRESFNAAAGETLVAFAGQTQAFNEQFTRVATQTMEGLSGHTETLRETVDQTTQTTLAAIGEKTDSMYRRLEVVTGATVVALEQQSRRIEQSFRQNVDHLETTVGSTTQETLAALVGHSNAFQEQFTQTAQQTIDALSMQGERLEHMVAAATQEQLAAMTGHTESFQQDFTRVAAETTELAEARAEKMRDALEQTSLFVGETLGKTVAATQTHFETVVEATLGAFHEKSHDQIAALSEHAEYFQEHFAQTTADTLEKAEVRTTSLRSSLDAIRGAVDGALSRNIAATESQFETATASAITAFQTKSQEQIDALSQHADAFQRHFALTSGASVVQAETQTRALRTSLDEIRTAVDETLGQNITATQTRFETATATAIEAFHSKAQEQIDALSQHADAFQRHFALTSGASVVQAEKQTRALRASLDEIRTAVDEALGQNITATQTRFETATATAIEAFHSKAQEQIDALSQHADAFQRHFAFTSGASVVQAETQTRTLRASLDEIRTAVDEALGQNITATQAQFEVATASAIEAFHSKAQEQIDALSQHADAFQQHFALTSGDSISHAETQTRALRASLDEIRNAVDEALGQNITATETRFETATAAAIDAFHSKAQEQIDALSQHADAFQQHFALTSGDSISHAETQTRALRASLDEIRTAVDETLDQNITATQTRFETATAAAIEAFHSKAQEQIDALSQHADAFQQHFALTSGDSLLQAEAQTTALRASLDETRAAIDEALGQNVAATQSQFEAATVAAIEAFHAKAQEQIDALSQHADAFQENFVSATAGSVQLAETRARTLGASLDAIRLAVDATLSRNVSATREQFEAATASAIGAFETKAQQQIDALLQHADAFQQNFSRTTEGAIDHAESRTEALRGSLEAIRVAVDDTLSSNIAETQARFESATEAAINGLLAQTATIDHNFVATTSHAADNISQRVTDAHKRFAQVASEAIAAIGVHGDRVNETLAERLDAFEATMLRGGDDASNSIGYHGEMLAQQIGASLKSFETHLDDSVARTRDRLAQHTERFNADFIGQLASLEALMRGGGESSADHIQAQTEVLRDVLADNLRGFERIVSELGGGAAERIDAQVAALEALMRDGGQSSADHIRTQTEILRETLANNLHGFERVASEIGGGASERISAQIASLENLMRDGGQSSADHIRTQTEILRDTLADNLREFEKRASEIGGGASERISAQIASLEKLMRDGGQSSADHIRTQTEYLRDTLADNLREFEKRASEIGGGAHERITAQIASLENLMRDGGQNSADHIRTQTEYLRDTLADNLREFEKRASEIGGGAHERISAQIASLENLMRDGGQSSAEHLRAETEHLRETLAGNLREFEKVTSEIGGGAAERIGGQIASLETLLRDGGRHSAEQIAFQTDYLRQTLAENLHEFEKTITDLGGGASERISAQIASLENLLRDGGQNSAAQIRTQADYLRVTLAGTLREFERTASDLGGGASERIGAQIASLETLLRDGGQNSANQIRVQTDYLRETLAGTLHEFENSVSELGGGASERISVQIASLENLMRDGGENSIAHIRAHTDYLRDALAENLRDFEKIVAELGGGATDRINAQIASLESVVRDGGETSVDRIKAQAEFLRASLADNLREFEKNVADVGGGATARIGAQAAKFVATLSDRLSAIESTIDTHGADLDARLGKRADATADLLALHIDRFESRATDKTHEIVGVIDNLIVKAEDGLTARSRHLNDALAGRAIDIAKVLGEGGREVGRALDAKARELDQIILSRSTALTEQLSAKAEEINSTLGGRANEIASTLGGHIDLFERNVVGRLGQVGEEMDRRIGQIEQTVDGRGRALTEELRARAAELHDWYDSNGMKLVDLLSSRGGEVVSQIVAYAESTVGALSSRSTDIIEQLGQRQAEITTVLDRTSRDMRHTLERVTKTLDAEIAQSTAAMSQTFDDKTSDSVAALSVIHQQLKQEIGGLLDGMGQTQTSLHDLFERTESGLGRLDANLGPQIGAFASAIEALHDELSRLDASTQDSVRHAEITARAIGGHNQVLAAGLREMEETQASLDKSLEQRLHGMEQFYEEAKKRQAEFESRLDGFSGAIGRALAQAEAKARDVGTFLTESVSATADALTGQYENLRSEAARERETTGVALTAAFEQNLGEMNQMFEKATERYKGVSQDLRNMTGEIQRELEATRKELQRGALELPRETAEQTAAMRRVVSDQIKALNELTDIVTRSGRSLDISEPAANARIEAVRQEPSRIETPPAPARQAWKAPAATLRREPTPAARTEQRAEPQRLDLRPTLPVRPQAQIPAPPPPEKTERSGGWMSDLLARASQDEQPARRSADPLENLSAEIARVVDETALMAAWDRYRNGDGDTTAFGRRLYTAQGGKTFDEVSRRYQTESDFRGTVDRYLQEFERLLAEIDHDDRDGSMTRSYLTSDSGKVYTLLAHAAGRLG